MATAEELAGFIKASNHDELRAALEADPGSSNLKIAGVSLIQFAAYCRNREAVDILRARIPRLNPFEATTVGDLSQVQQHLREDAGIIQKFSDDGFTMLGLAAYFGHRDLVEFLLEAGADPNVASENPFHVTPLHSACAISDEAIAQILIAKGAKVNAKQRGGYTPLHSAAHNGVAGLAELLIRNGADVNAKADSGQTPLAMARESGHDSVAALIQRHDGS